MSPRPQPDTRTSLERTEEELSWAGLALAGTIRAGEFAVIAIIALLVCPPLAILTVVVVVPLLVIALVLGLVAAVISTPYLLVHHFRAHDGRHLSLLKHRLGLAGRALFDLAPHRIVADARKVDRGR
jgi:uncharacterized membrane protein